MKPERIGLLSDIHGNSTAFKAVLDDGAAQGVTQFWLLGDIYMPGPGTADLFELIDTYATVCIRGNWDDCLLDAVAGDAELRNPTDVYIARLSQYVYDAIGDEGVARVASWPLSQMVHLSDLDILVCHNLPGKNWGSDILRTADQASFDTIFDGIKADMAVIGHTHSPYLRYGSDGQIIINPGSVGQSPVYDAGPANDLRARYAILTVDDVGIPDIAFRRVPYDRDTEIQEARNAGLPYLDLYAESLECGNAHTHDHETLGNLNEEFGYQEEAAAFLASRVN